MCQNCIFIISKMQIFDLKYRYKKWIARAVAELVLLVCMEGTFFSNNLVLKSWALAVCKSSVARK